MKEFLFALAILGPFITFLIIFAKAFEKECYHNTNGYTRSIKIVKYRYRYPDEKDEWWQKMPVGLYGLVQGNNGDLNIWRLQ